MIVRRLGSLGLTEARGALALFAEVFGDSKSYQSAPPGDAYLARLLSDDRFILLIAEIDDETVGALAAYELVKFEQERSEIYIYDLGVVDEHRRKGVATALIEALKPIAQDCGAWVIYVQADPGDDPALALYRKLGTEESVFHYDITVD